MQMSTAADISAMEPVSSNSPVTAIVNCGDSLSLSNNVEYDPNTLSPEERLKCSMSYWQENARRHAPREKEQLDAQEARDKEERAALRKRHISDQRQKESSSKKENVSAQMNSFSGQSTRKRSHEISPADAAREEYRMGFAGMGASVASRPVNLNMDRWIYQQHQAQQQQQQQHQHQHQHHYNNMVKMHQQHMMQQHMPVNNGAPVAQPHMNMMHNGLHGSGGLIISNGINAGGSPHPPASFSVHQQQIMQHQPPQNAAQSQVQMMGSSVNNGECTSFSGASHDNATPLPSEPTLFQHNSPHQHNTFSAGENSSTISSTQPNNEMSKQGSPDHHLNCSSPAIDVGEQVDDNALQFFAQETANIFLQDLGPEDLFPDSDEIADLNETATSSVGPVHQQNSVHSLHSGQNSVHQGDCDSVGNSLLSPPFQQTLNGTGPLSAHSVHSQNPMSNGNCNPPLTPNGNSIMTPGGSASAAMQVQRFPTPTQPGVRPTTSTPMLPSTSTGVPQQMHLPQQLMSQSNEMRISQANAGMMTSSMSNSSTTVQAMQHQQQFPSQQQQIQQQQQHMMMQSGGYVPTFSSEMAIMPDVHQIMPQCSMMPMAPHMNMQMMQNDLQRQQYLQHQHQQRAAAAQSMYQRGGMPVMNMAPHHYAMMQPRPRMMHQQMNQPRYPQGVMDPQLMARQQQLMPMQQLGGMGPSTSYPAYSGTSVINQSPMYSQFPMN